MSALYSLLRTWGRAGKGRDGGEEEEGRGRKERRTVGGTDRKDDGRFWNLFLIHFVGGSHFPFPFFNLFPLPWFFPFLRSLPLSHGWSHSPAH